MFPYLRLARGYRPVDLCRWLLTAVASAAVAALLLRALGWALTVPPVPIGHPGPGTHPAGPLPSAVAARLLWCLPPLAGVGYLAAAWARSAPLQQPERVAGLLAAGFGQRRLRVLLAVEIALACVGGAVLGLLGFLVLRAHLLELLPDGRLDPALGARNGLPIAGTATLLSTVPLVGGLAAAAAVRPALLRPPDEGDVTQRRPSVLYLVAAVLVPLFGTLVELAAVRRGATTTALLGGALALVGLGLAMPALLYATGMALAWRHPHPVRLLAGRGLQAGAWQLGTPIAVLIVTLTAGAVAADRLGLSPGPLLTVEGALIVLCVLGALLTRMAELSVSRRRSYSPLTRMGAPGALLRQCAALRGGMATLVALAAGGGAAALAAALSS
ncbi:hypothetical protein [Streptacidiphilus albus]|uniref:hypothetical protein n=1 Tax=Streptacidiphilus albus TaxID=105425 RepID=UPI00054BFADB|nr:hypothetical protein [Streptacidiphilus albus]